MHEMIFDSEAIDFLNSLPKEIKERIFKKIASTKENPYHFFERLAGRLDYKLRIGDYRVIADISESQIQVTKIGHRKNIYDKI
jgi:mRNA interferase RelE/StbE